MTPAAALEAVWVRADVPTPNVTLWIWFYIAGLCCLPIDSYPFLCVSVLAPSSRPEAARARLYASPRGTHIILVRVQMYTALLVHRFRGPCTCDAFGEH